MIRVIFWFLKNKKGYVVYRALFARDKACLNADLLLLADLSAILRALLIIRTLKAALFSSLFRLLATTSARLADLLPELRLADLLEVLLLDLLEPLFREAILLASRL